MKKYKKIIIMVLVVLILSSLLIGGYLYLKTRNKTYTKAKYDTASLQEKEKLDYFYEGSIPISKGKYFDMRYLYYDGKCLGNIQIEAVKKVEENIGIDEITIYNEKGTKILFESLSEDSFLNPEFPKKEKGRPNVIRSINDNRYYGYIYGGDMFFLRYVLEEIHLKDPIEYQNLQEITIKIKIDDYVETHKLVFDRKESLNTLLKVQDWKHDKKKETKSYYLSHYYGLLFTENFGLWKQEIEFLLKENSADLSWPIIFNLPSIHVQEFSMKQFQEYLNLSNENFEVYLLYYNMALEKKFLKEDYLDQMLLK